MTAWLGLTSTTVDQVCTLWTWRANGFVVELGTLETRNN